MDKAESAPIDSPPRRRQHYETHPLIKLSARTPGGRVVELGPGNGRTGLGGDHRIGVTVRRTASGEEA